MKSIAIICGGGPAPGINTVISAVSKVFLKDGYRVLGVHEGYKGLFSTDPNYVDIDFAFADRIFSRGGSSLTMSRFKPKDHEFNADFFIKNDVKLLVTIGGDDTASTANRISKFLRDQHIDVKNIHVPKTIDNDLPLPERNPTFGFHSAKDEGVKIGSTIYEDARTSNCWFIISSMGRTAGHLGIGIATACHFPMFIIPEMFGKTKITFEKVIDLIISSIVKRKINNINYGVALVSEGIFLLMDEEEIINSGFDFTYDDHGHPELGNVSKAHILNIMLQRRMKELHMDAKTRPVELGYELRCCRPIGYDLTLCTLLGIGVKKLYDDGVTGCIVSTDSKGDISPLYLKDLADENGKISPRLVDVNGDFFKLAFHNLDFISAKDKTEALKYMPDPEKYYLSGILTGLV